MLLGSSNSSPMVISYFIFFFQLVLLTITFSFRLSCIISTEQYRVERNCVLSTISLNVYQSYPSFAAYVRNYDFYIQEYHIWETRQKIYSHQNHFCYSELKHRSFLIRAGTRPLVLATCLTDEIVAHFVNNIGRCRIGYSSNFKLM